MRKDAYYIDEQEYQTLKEICYQLKFNRQMKELQDDLALEA